MYYIIFFTNWEVKNLAWAIFKNKIIWDCKFNAMEFTKVAECIEYCQSNNLAFFRRDLNSNFAKIMVADTYQNIFDKIKKGDNKFYESWSPSQYMKFFVDYEKKIEIIDTMDVKKRLQKINEDHLTHKNDILNIINYVKTLLPNVSRVYILKSIPDVEKKSYHIIFDGVHFPNYKNMKVFVEEQLKLKFKDLFDKKIIDTTVYAPKCFRSLLCSKFGQNRPLFLLDTNKFLSELNEDVISPEETTFEHFKKTSLTYIEGNSVLFSYKPTDKKKETNKKVHLINDGDIYSDKEVIRKYIDILDPDRYTDRNKWINVGYILHSINRENIDLWHYFSSKWENYNEKDCDVAWESFENSEYIYTIHNLMHLTQIDNPDDYVELSTEIPSHDIKYLRPFDNIISKVIYRLYGEKFVCSNPEKNEWYYFNGIRWVKENKSFNLRKLMINEVFTKVENYRRLLIKEGASEELVKNYHNILKILGSGNKLNCLELEFYNSNFYKIIDQNKDLIGFENGVYDLQTMEFRKGNSSDYISLSSGYEFIHFAPNSKDYRDLFDLLCKILPHEDVRHFTLKSLASCLDGHIRDENFYIFSGKNNTGGNGKSTIMDLLLKSMGEYACVSPVTLVTAKRESANSANSALASIRNKRAVIMQEPESNEMIQAGTMKALTGGDRISTRELHSSQMEFKPHAKFFMCCNKIPAISDLDGGVIRRLKITEFVSRFVEEPNNDNLEHGIYEYKIDTDLKSRLDSYKSVFMSILLDYYKMYKDEGLNPPKPVMRVTKKYENDNNIIKHFIDENICTGSKQDFITKEQLKDIFKADFTIGNTFGKFNAFIKQLENALCVEFKLDKKNVAKIQNWRIKQPEDSGDDDDDCESVASV
jgi:P4 family phage/plasmid primase-like protien